ncbi:beta-lactamase [Solidesulfovibrio carbinoliphilus subsp. oakridgensis]|uniref:Beta-lactamase n=1 Tax=Solidesulfovibrio carbinoliphilus subsp. oakridgensis TaxID=694327 RepID=G7Q9F8_9BACT|nr:serine hydrolase domain-containing protein [Solidesulfovibrio carbinoliphilus]EHJ48201.1 beta-lactamase [Solidesulfovibrio carbinoliphilus subsp. oakridgensis]
MTRYAALVEATGDLRPGAATAVVPWWSFTKPLIAACLLRLAGKGQLDIEARLDAYPFTVRDLLQHRAGVGDYGALAEYREAVSRGDAPWSDQALLARVSPDRLLFAPRTGWAYSNVGYLLLRRLIERICGTGLGEALAALVLGPLGLVASRLAERPADMAATAFPGGHGYQPGWCFHGTVIGPVAEAALALHRLLAGELLAPAWKQAFLEPFLLAPGMAGRPWHTAGYGLGLMRGTMKRPGMDRPLAVAGHSAGGPGSVGAVYHALDRGGGRTVAVFADAEDASAVETRALALLAGR